MITRRTLLQAIGCAAASFVIPGQRRNINLMDFCGENSVFDCTLPHHVGDWTYASDAQMAVRVRPTMADALHHTSDRIPPFPLLPWDKSKLIWRPIPKLEPMVAMQSICPQCEGAGYWPKPPKKTRCESCWGDGCAKCDGRGTVAPGYECSICLGRGNGKFPSIVKIGECYLDARRFGKFSAMDGEYAVDPEFKNAFLKTNPLFRFRFADGDGMLLPVNPKLAVERIEDAKTKVTR